MIVRWIIREGVSGKVTLRMNDKKELASHGKRKPQDIPERKKS